MKEEIMEKLDIGHEPKPMWIEERKENYRAKVLLIQIEDQEEEEEI